MNATHLHQKISRLQQRVQTKYIESLLVLITLFFITAFLPSILLRYVYTNLGPFEQPAALTYIPVVSFLFGVIYLGFSFMQSSNAQGQIKRLEMELQNAELLPSEVESLKTLKELESLMELEKASSEKTSSKSKKSPSSTRAKKSTGRKRGRPRKSEAAK